MLNFTHHKECKIQQDAAKLVKTQKVQQTLKLRKHQQNRAFTALYKVQLLPKNKRVCSALF